VKAVGGWDRKYENAGCISDFVCNIFCVDSSTAVIVSSGLGVGWVPPNLFFLLGPEIS
jgi:hypothetical protein